MAPHRIGIPFALTASIVGIAAAQKPDFSELDRYLKDQVAKRAAPSISAAVVKDGKVVYAKAFGYADLENEVLATPESVYRIGSITKQFTATMIMQLIGEKKLTLDQPFRTILPDTPGAWDKVTVRQLLNHTSGIKPYTEVPGLFADAALKPTNPAGILKTVEKEPLGFAPGSQWHYNNTAYEILGMIVEKLDDRKYADSLHARILDPLGMKSTYFTSERSIVKHRAQGYEPNGKAFLHAPYLNMDWPYAAGSIESTTLDLAKWDAALYGERILPQSVFKEMWKQAVLSTGKKEDYGFGFQLAKLNGVDIVQHGGGIHGFITFIRRAPEHGLTVVILTNSGSAPSDQIAIKAMGIVDPNLREAPPKVAVDTDKPATDKARAILQSIMDGKLDRSILTPEFNKILTPTMEHGAQTQLSAFGKIGKFRLLSNEAKEGSTTRTYLVTLGSTELKMTVTINTQGLIAGIDLHP